jgi:chromate transporter
LPGPEAQQLAVYIGWLMHRTWGGIIAGTLFVLPSLFILIALSWIYLAYGDVPAVAGVLYGIKPAVTAIVLFAAYRIGSRALKHGVLWAMAAAAFLAIFVFDVPFPAIVLAAGLIGYVGGRVAPEKFATGGAYAVLPYVYQGAVEHYHWLTPLQMMDGLALGETTPGPLIMVVAFVGFVGGWTQASFGPDALFLAAASAAAVVTFFTFLPSFIFIFIGGPLVESTHGDLKFTAPLTGITAAVVGVILNLALFFGYHVLWPEGFAGRFDWVSAAIVLAATIALFRFKRNIIEVIAACAVLGFVVRTIL